MAFHTRTPAHGPGSGHHLLDPAWLLHGQAQQFVSGDLHEEGVEDPNLFGVDVPDEGGLFPETLSHLALEDRDGSGWRPVSQVHRPVTLSHEREPK